MAIQVLDPGAFTTIQDSGRYGYQALGVSVSGPMDPAAYAAANRLCGNSKDSAVLEMTLLGGLYLFDSPCRISLCGADMSPMLNERPAALWTRISVSAGDRLRLGFAKNGCRLYMAVSGGIDTPLFLGSRSTNVRCRMGGTDGRALKAGDLLPVGKQAGDPADLPEECSIPASDIPSYGSGISVRAVPGPQDDYFTEKGLSTFFSSVYTMENGSDRMGIRLSGDRIESISGTDILSDGTVFGSVQVTRAGQPIVLMADRQTTGGYAKIATVLSCDLWKLAQMRPGDTVTFVRAEL